MTRSNKYNKSLKGMLIAFAIGSTAVLLENSLHNNLLDPLLVAMVIGITLRSFVKFDESSIAFFRVAPIYLISVGAILYGAVNLNFMEFSSVDIDSVFTMIISFIIFVISSLTLANLFGLKEKTGYLVAAGSAICGASAIAIMTKSVDADPEDVSISLIAVFISGLISLFLIIPLTVKVLNLSQLNTGVLSGAVLQFTGFVKVSCANLPPVIKNTALSIKALRYCGLLFLVPLFASFTKGRVHVPWFLWGFFFSGLVFSFAPGMFQDIRPVLKIVLSVLWSIAMASIGLNANIRVLFTRTGFKAFAVSILSFIAATATFLVCMKYK